MFKFLELSKEYLLEQSTEVTYEQLNTIITTPFNSSKYLTYGNFINVDPPTFLLINKWYSWGRPLFHEFAATKILVAIRKNGNHTTLSVTTKTNPILLLMPLLSVIAMVIQFITQQSEFGLKDILSIFLLFIICFLLDRFLKTQLFASLENDLKLTQRP
jgi:hypothetical protein